MLIVPLHLVPGLPDAPHHGLLQCVGPGAALGPVHVGGHVGQADVELGVPLQRATCHREVLVTPLLYDHHLDCGAAQPGPARPAPLHHVHPALAEVGGHEAAPRQLVVTMSRAVLPGHAPLRGVAVQGRPPLLTQHLGLLECSPVGQGCSDDGQACQHITHLISPT